MLFHVSQNEIPKGHLRLLIASWEIKLLISDDYINNSPQVGTPTDAAQKNWLEQVFSTNMSGRRHIIVCK